MASRASRRGRLRSASTLVDQCRRPESRNQVLVANLEISTAHHRTCLSAGCGGSWSCSELDGTVGPSARRDPGALGDGRHRITRCPARQTTSATVAGGVLPSFLGHVDSGHGSRIGPVKPPLELLRVIPVSGPSTFPDHGARPCVRRTRCNDASSKTVIRREVMCAGAGTGTERRFAPFLARRIRGGESGQTR